MDERKRCGDRHQYQTIDSRIPPWGRYTIEWHIKNKYVLRIRKKRCKKCKKEIITYEVNENIFD